MTKIKMMMYPMVCHYITPLPDEDGEPSGRTADSSWRIATAMDESFHVYDIYWDIREDYDTEEAANEEWYQEYDWENPTAIICNGKDVTKDVTVIW